MELTQTQEKLLVAAKTLLLSKGYPATTVDEICESAGVSKGSFYNAFPSKEAMGLSLLGWYHEGGQKKVFGGKYNLVEDPRGGMFQFLKEVEKNSKTIWGEGCLLGNLGMELAETSPKIKAEVASLFKKISSRLEVVFAPAASGKKGKARLSAKELAEQFLVMLEGSILMARIYGNWGIVTRSFKNFEVMLKNNMK